MITSIRILPGARDRQPCLAGGDGQLHDRPGHLILLRGEEKLLYRPRVPTAFLQHNQWVQLLHVELPVRQHDPAHPGQLQLLARLLQHGQHCSRRLPTGITVQVQLTVITLSLFFSDLSLWVLLVI